MRTRLFLLLTVFALTFLVKGFCQTPAWAISGSFTSIASDYSGNLYTADDKTVTLYDTSAQVVWRKDYGAAIKSLATAPDHALYITGSFSERIQLGNYTLTPAGAHSVYVARLDDEGVVQWAKQLDRPASPLNLQLATDSWGSVYVSWTEGHLLHFTKLWPNGTNRFTKSLFLGDYPYGDPVNTILVDKQDNLHVCYSSPYVPNPADPLNTVNAQSREWYDSAGLLLGSERNIKKATREVFRGYKARGGPDDYLYTKTYRTITGAGSTWLSDCSSPQVLCYDFPPINPDYDRFGGAYYAGHFYERGGGIDCGPPPQSFQFFCSNAVTRKDVVYLEKDMYVLFGDTLVSTKDQGLTDEYPIWLSADPNGRSLYILASWSSRGADTGKFYFGSSTLSVPGRMVLRYRVNRPVLRVSAGEDKVVCPGGTAVIGTLDMVENGKAPYVYNWQPAAGLSNTSAPNPTAQPETSTQYVVTVTDAAGAMGRDTVTVVVDGTLYRPAITLAAGANPFCEGDTIVLRASQAASYQWSNGATSQDIHLSAPDTLVLRAVNAEGCRGTSAPFIATMNPKPPSPRLTQSGNLLKVEPAAVAYKWYLNGQFLSETTTQSLSIDEGGVYKVVIKDTNGCQSSATLEAVVHISTSWIDYQVFPNPVTSDLNIMYALRQTETISVTLNDVFGHRVVTIQEGQQQAPGEYRYLINRAAARLQKGYYFVEFRSGTKRIVQKVVVL